MNPVRALVEAEVRLGGFPGAAWAYGVPGDVRAGVAGRQTYCPESRPIHRESVWDLASVSKVVATTTLAMRAWDAGGLDLDRPVALDLRGFGASGKGAVTPRHLLTHTSGLVAFRPYHLRYRKPDDVPAAIDAEGLLSEPGAKTVYSDLSMIVLARLLERLEGETLPVLLRRHVADPLRLDRTGAFPADRGFGSAMRADVPREEVVPTEIVEPWRRDLRRATYGDLGAARRFGEAPDYIQGEVHDPTATVLGGVAGHAGLFSALDDLARFAENLLAPSPRLVSRAAVGLFTKRQGPASTRALGWDTKSEGGSSAGTLFGGRSFGHTGYTGTSLWLDPDAEEGRGFYAILLTNRVHPTSANDRILAFRPRFHDAARRSWGERSGEKTRDLSL